MAHQRHAALDDAEYLRRAYVEEGLSQYEIADQIGCSQTSVKLALRRAGIPGRSRRRYHTLPLLNDAEGLHRAYVEDGLSQRQIAAQIGCSQTLVQQAILRHGITMRATGLPQRVFPGQRYGRLEVIAEEAGRKNGGRAFRCRCDCGSETVVKSSKLTNGHTRSCGCLSRVHGYHGSPTYISWRAMKQRCSTPLINGYHNYGGRGVTVCERWLTFENFLADMGERPAGMTLDRIDPWGNYEPGNCRWATPAEQSRNKRAS